MGTRIIVNTAKAEAAAEKAATEIVEECIQAGLESSKRFVPIKTGALHDSLRSEQEGAEGSYGSDLEYSIYVEMGTGKMGAQPYLRPSIDAMRGLLE